MNSTMPCGRASIGVSCGMRSLCQYVADSSVTSSMVTAPISTDAKGGNCADSSTVMVAAPRNPPMLKKAWKPDIITRRASRSTMTACTFIVQSIAPTAASNTNSTRPSAHAELANARPGTVRQISRLLATITRRQPRRAASTPDKGIASSEPAPRQSSTSPSVASLIPVRALANGTRVAHNAVAKPGMKNAARVACCSARARLARDMSSTVREAWGAPRYRRRGSEPPRRAVRWWSAPGRRSRPGWRSASCRGHRAFPWWRRR